MPLFDATAASFLTVDRQRELIELAQDVPVTVEVRDGEERLVHGTTPASDAALEELTRAFLPALRKAAIGSRKLEVEEDAFGLVLAEFVAAVRRYDLTSDVPFSATIATVLQRAVSDADRTSGLIAVKENVAARYLRLMHKHGGDVGAAYDECVSTSNGFDPLTFLAVHRALRGPESLDVTVGSQDSTYRAAGGGIAEASAHEGALGDAAAGSFVDEFADADLVRWLFTVVDDRQESILRAAYGFRDLATENFLVAAGLRPGEVLSDVQVAEVLSLARSTVQRDRKKALELMRDAYRQLLDDEDAQG